MELVDFKQHPRFWAYQIDCLLGSKEIFVTSDGIGPYMHFAPHPRLNRRDEFQQIWTWKYPNMVIHDDFESAGQAIRDWRAWHDAWGYPCTTS